MIIALYLDIPEASQKVLLAATGAEAKLRLTLNDVFIGDAASGHLWAPKEGAYRLTPEDAMGRIKDRVYFTVRGAGVWEKQAQTAGVMVWLISCGPPIGVMKLGEGLTSGVIPRPKLSATSQDILGSFWGHLLN